MLVFWRQRLVFLATPKTGSTALEAALAPLASMVILRPPHLKHTNIQRYRRHLAPFFDDSADKTPMTTLALMREPLDWLGSWYRYRRRPEEVPEKSTGGVTFDRFVQDYCSKERPEYANIGAQANFLSPKSGNPVDLIFRYEDMPGVVAFLQERLRTTIELGRINISPTGDCQLSPTTRKLLEQHCERDFALYESLNNS